MRRGCTQCYGSLSLHFSVKNYIKNAGFDRGVRVRLGNLRSVPDSRRGTWTPVGRILVPPLLCRTCRLIHPWCVYVARAQQCILKSHEEFVLQAARQNRGKLLRKNNAHNHNSVTLISSVVISMISIRPLNLYVCPCHDYSVHRKMGERRR